MFCKVPRPSGMAVLLLCLGVIPDLDGICRGPPPAILYEQALPCATGEMCI